MEQSPLDVLNEIGNHLCKFDLYRDKYDVARDAMAFFAASKSDIGTRSIARHMLESLTKSKYVNGFESEWVHSCDLGSVAHVKDLKTVCKELNIPVSGTKNALVQRILERRKARWRVILDDSVVKEVVGLRYKVVSSYIAISLYGLETKELNELESCSNGYYKLREVREASCKKFSGQLSELRRYLDQRSEIRKARQDARVERIDKRRIEMQSALERYGCPMEMIDVIGACSAYVRSGIGNPHDIAKTAQEIMFLKEHTIFDQVIEMIDHYEDLSEMYDATLYPKELHIYAKRLAMKDWVKQFPRGKSQALESQVLPETLKKYVSNMPRYAFLHD